MLSTFYFSPLSLLHKRISDSSKKFNLLFNTESSIESAQMTTFTRSIHTSSQSLARAYKSVVNRQIAAVPQFEVGDVKPTGMYIPSSKPKYPVYPYGEARIFKRADHGLYGGQVIGFGNQISEMKNKSSRTWLPNVVSKKLWSESLNRFVKMRLTTRVLKTITKEGGLDNYVTKEKAARIKELGQFGWKLKYDVLQARLGEHKPSNYELVGDNKVYYQGAYQGKQVQITVGKRSLLKKLFPKVAEGHVTPLSLKEFGAQYKSKTMDEVVALCEQHNVDLAEFAV